MGDRRSRPGESIRVSVVVPTYRAPDLVLEAVGSLLPVPPEGEVIVVDDGSGDDTAQLVRERFPSVRVIVLDQNRGFGGAVNAGFLAARGEYLATLNNDARAHWPAFSELARFLDDHPQAAAVAPALVGTDGCSQRVAFSFPRPPWARMLYRVRHSRRVGDSAPYTTEYVKGACVLFRRAALEQVGLFDEQFWMFAEELDLFRRLANAGWQTWVLPQLRVVHRGGTTTRNHPDRKESSRYRQQSYASICRYYAKHHAAPVAWILRAELAVRVLGRLGCECARLLVGRGDPWWVAEHGRCLRTLVRRWPSRPRERKLQPASGDGG